MQDTPARTNTLRNALIATQAVVFGLFAWGWFAEPAWVVHARAVPALRPLFASLSLLGTALVITSLFFRVKGTTPFASLNPRHWIPVWRQKSYFRPPGFHLMLVGFEIFGIATLAMIFITAYH